jgi:hypothetical protein
VSFFGTHFSFSHNPNILLKSDFCSRFSARIVGIGLQVPSDHFCSRLSWVNLSVKFHRISDVGTGSEIGGVNFVFIGQKYPKQPTTLIPLGFLTYRPQALIVPLGT